MAWVYNPNTNSFDYQSDSTPSTTTPVQYPMTADSSGTTTGSLNQTTTSTLPAWLQPYAQQLAQSAGSLANAPVTPYTGQYTAPLTSPELQGIQQAGTMQGQAQQGLNAATNIYQTMGQYGTQGPTQTQLNAYMNPYLRSVVEASQKQQQDEYTREKNALEMQQGQIGAFGGSGSFIAQSELARNYADQLARNTANQLYQGYSAAQQGVLSGMNVAGTAAAGLGNTAMQGQQASLADIGALYTAGGLERGISQADLDARYQEFVRQQQAKQTNLGTASNIISNLIGPLAGKTTGQTSSQTTTQSTPSAPLTSPSEPMGPNPKDTIQSQIDPNNPIFGGPGGTQFGGGTISPAPSGTGGTTNQYGVPISPTGQVGTTSNIRQNPDGTYSDTTTGQTYDPNGIPLLPDGSVDSSKFPPNPDGTYPNVPGYAWWAASPYDTPKLYPVGPDGGFIMDPETGLPKTHLAQGGLVPGYAQGGIAGYEVPEHISTSTIAHYARGGLAAAANMYTQRLAQQYDHQPMSMGRGLPSQMQRPMPMGRMMPQGLPQRPQVMSLQDRYRQVSPMMLGRPMPMRGYAEGDVVGAEADSNAVAQTSQELEQAGITKDQPNFAERAWDWAKAHPWKTAAIAALLALEARTGGAGLIPATAMGLAKLPRAAAGLFKARGAINPALGELGLSAPSRASQIASIVGKPGTIGSMARLGAVASLLSPEDTAKDVHAALKPIAEAIAPKPAEAATTAPKTDDTTTLLADLIKQVQSGTAKPVWNEALAKQAYQANFEGGDPNKAARNAGKAYVKNIMEQLQIPSPSDRKIDQLTKLADLQEAHKKGLIAAQEANTQARTAALEAAPAAKQAAMWNKNISNAITAKMSSTGQIPTPEDIQAIMALYASVPGAIGKTIDFSALPK